MARTPGFVIPSSYSSQEELEEDLRRRSEDAGYTELELSHSSDDPFAEQMDSAADFLSHYGVKGMKWGVRKGEVSKSGRVKEAPSEDAQRVGGIHARVKSQKTTKMLSNKELEDAIKRMNLEQQYSRLTGGLDKTTKQKVSSFISEMVKGAAKQTAQELTKNELKSQIQSQVNKQKAAS